MPDFVVNVVVKNTFQVTVTGQADEATALATALALDLSAVVPDTTNSTAIPVQQVGEPWVIFPPAVTGGDNDPNGSQLVFQAARGTVFSAVDAKLLFSRVAALGLTVKDQAGGGGSGFVRFLVVASRGKGKLYVPSDVAGLVAVRPASTGSVRVG